MTPTINAQRAIIRHQRIGQAFGVVPLDIATMARETKTSAKQIRWAIEWFRSQGAVVAVVDNCVYVPRCEWQKFKALLV